MIESFKTYLKTVPPFDILQEEDLQKVAGVISLEYYPKGYKILVQNGPPAEHLRVIKKGGVKIYVTDQDSKEIVIDYRSERELFGFISLVSSDRSRATVQTVEETVCYLIPKDMVMELLQRYPVINQFFYRSFFINFIDKTREETRKRHPFSERSGHHLITTTAGQLVRRPPVTANTETSIFDASKIMSRERIGSIVVMEGGIPVGIVTDRDLREKVIAKGRGIDQPLRYIMSTPLIRIDAAEPAFEALLKMIRYNIHHLAVVENGGLKGVLSHHDLMLLQGSSPMILVKEIEESQRIEDLFEIRSRLLQSLRMFLIEGLKVQSILGLLSEFYERMVQKVIKLIEKRIGPSPLPFTLIIFGEGARREMTLAPRIILGVVLEDTNKVPLLDRTISYFKNLSSILTEYSGQIGISGKDILPEDFVKCRQQWSVAIKKWISSPFRYRVHPEIFDVRYLSGDEEIFQGLFEPLFNKATSATLLGYLASETVENRPPLGFFKRFVVEKGGEHKNQFDLYQKGIRPVVDIMRIFSYEVGLKSISTFSRIEDLRLLTGRQIFADLGFALEYMFTLLLHEQIQKEEMSDAVDSFINPERLSPLEKKTLKEAFKLIFEVYEEIQGYYRPATV